MTMQNKSLDGRSLDGRSSTKLGWRAPSVYPVNPRSKTGRPYGGVVTVIRAYAAEHPSFTARQLAADTGLDPARAQSGCNSLFAEGELVATYRPNPEGKGRPIRCYGLPTKNMPVSKPQPSAPRVLQNALKIEVGLHLLRLNHPGESLTLDYIAEVCGVSRRAIAFVQERALRKLARALEPFKKELLAHEH